MSGDWRDPGSVAHIEVVLVMGLLQEVGAPKGLIHVHATPRHTAAPTAP
jgi:hypothetical protein